MHNIVSLITLWVDAQKPAEWVRSELTNSKQFEKLTIPMNMKAKSKMLFKPKSIPLIWNHIKNAVDNGQLVFNVESKGAQRNFFNVYLFPQLRERSMVTRALRPWIDNNYEELRSSLIYLNLPFSLCESLRKELSDEFVKQYDDIHLAMQTWFCFEDETAYGTSALIEKDANEDGKFEKDRKLILEFVEEHKSFIIYSTIENSAVDEFIVSLSGVFCPADVRAAIWQLPHRYLARHRKRFMMPELKQELKTGYDENYAPCSKCGKEWPTNMSSESWKQHKQTPHVCSCSKCETRFTCNRDRLIHLREVHGIAEICPFCHMERQEMTKANFKRHINSPHDFQCPKCLLYLQKEQIAHHNEWHNSLTDGTIYEITNSETMNVDSEPCSKCGMEWPCNMQSQEWELHKQKLHVQLCFKRTTPSPLPPTARPKCDKRFVCNRDHLIHLRKVHGIVDICPKCHMERKKMTKHNFE